MVVKYAHVHTMGPKELAAIHLANVVNSVVICISYPSGKSESSPSKYDSKNLSIVWQGYEASEASYYI